MSTNQAAEQIRPMDRSYHSAVASAPAGFALFGRPSMTGLTWAALDIATTLIASMIALRFRSDVAESSGVTTTVQITGELWGTFGIYLAWFALCLIFFTRSYGLYGPIQNRSGLNEQRMTIQAALVAGLILCGTIYLSRGEQVSRIVVVLSVLLTGAMLCARRSLWRSLVYSRYRDGIDTRNVLIIGSGRVAHALRNHLESLRHLGFRFKGFIALDDRERASGEPDTIGSVHQCVALARALFVDEIFFSVPAEKDLVIRLVADARAVGIDVRVVPDLYDGLAWNASVEYVGQFPTIPLHRREFPIGSFMIKRVLDLVLSSIALAALLPVLATVAAAVRIDSRGSILYPANRIGRKGRTFRCYKFRTMVQHADQLHADMSHLNERDGVLFKVAKDPRITRIGRLLRKYSLDELPQFWNVLRGDMSLVGPRPPIASEVQQYDLSHLRRLDVLPGITGLWQVEARQDPSFDSYISLDTAYVENWTLWLDLKILVRTISVVLGGTGT